MLKRKTRNKVWLSFKLEVWLLISHSLSRAKFTLLLPKTAPFIGALCLTLTNTWTLTMGIKVPSTGYVAIPIGTLLTTQSSSLVLTIGLCVFGMPPTNLLRNYWYATTRSTTLWGRRSMTLFGLPSPLLASPPWLTMGVSRFGTWG
jgi:hypothetical protein